jgi:RHS repeat-associated protein
MKKIYSILILLLSSICTNAQTLQKFQYWFDTDFGNAISVPISGSNINYNSIINSSGLDAGLHTISYRFLANDSVWSSVSTSFFTQDGATITEVQYWFDGDYNNNASIPVSSNNQYAWQDSINTSSLGLGVHIISYRFKSIGGIYSSTISSSFNKGGGNSSLSLIKYWIDDNYNNAIDLPITATTDFNWNQAFSATNLTLGLHKLTFMVQNSQGQWSSATSSLFEKEQVGTANIVAYQYWFRDNYASATYNTITPTTDYNYNATVTAPIVPDTMNDVMHIAFIDNLGQWSSPLTLTFENRNLNGSGYAIDVVQPTAGTYTTGQSVPLEWTVVGLNSSHSIQWELWDPSGNIFYGPALFPGVGTPNDSTDSWVIPNTIPSGSYKLKAYKLGCNLGNNCAYDWSDVITITNTSSAPTLAVLTPSIYSSYNCGQAMPITWQTTNVASNATMVIEALDASTNTPLYVINNNVPNTGSYTWYMPTTLPAGLSTGIIKIKVYQSGGVPNNTSASFYLTCNTNYLQCVNWDTNPIIPTNIDQEAFDAFQYLCSKNIILSNQITNNIDADIIREDLAKIVYKGVYAPNGAGNPYVTVIPPSENFPVPYLDLQPPSTSYPREAKALCYLEYGDGTSPFDRKFTHFRPKGKILKKQGLKVILEAFNIAPAASNAPAPWPSGTYTDVAIGSGEYGYIVKAYQLNIIGNATTFGFAQNLSRRNAIRYLTKLLKLYEVSSPLVGSKTIPVDSNYFQPFNVEESYLSRLFNIIDGAFNSYTKTSFQVSGIVPLQFEHNYNSANTDAIDGLVAYEPLGKGWNHNFNNYIISTSDTAVNDTTWLMAHSSGSFSSYKKVGNTFKCQQPGDYSKLTLINNGAKFVLTSKSQIVMEYDKLTGVNNTWVLSKIKDRNNNALTITWTASNGKAMVSQVADPNNRTLNFTYNANQLLTGVTCNTGSITRSISYAYNANNELIVYKNPIGDSTKYVYENYNDLTKRYLLKEIILPKGNKVVNTYNNSKRLMSSNVNNQQITNLQPATKYISGNNSNFTSAVINSTVNGNTTQTQTSTNRRGDPVKIVTNTDETNITYNANKPEQLNNISLTNLNEQMTPVYDSVGNLLSMTVSAIGMPTKTEQFKYNSTNDIIEQTNSLGYKTTYAYNSNGNPIQVTNHLGQSVNFTYNSNGTVQQITNPSGIFSNFSYNANGNTISTSIMNGLQSFATYDDASRVTTATDAKGIVTSYSYDNLDRGTQVVYDFGGLNNTMTYSYDKNGNMTSVTNPKGDATNYTYNDRDEMTQYNFQGLIKKYSYRADGLLDSFVNQKGQLDKYVYDNDLRLIDDGYAVYKYDTVKGNVDTIMHKTNGSKLSYQYDGYQRIKQVSYSDFAANKVQYEYDKLDRIIKISYPGGFAVKYEYNAINQLVAVRNAANNTAYASYTYLADGRLNTVLNANGTKTKYFYDIYGRQDSIANLKSNDSIICAYGFDLDNIGNHIAEYNTEPFAPLFILPTADTVAYTHSVTNRMMVQGNNTYTYDGNGNDSTHTGSTPASFTWDKRENLLTATKPNLSCEYDGTEVRRRKNNTRFVIDAIGNNVIMETDLSGNPIAYYIHGLGLICRLDAAQANAAYYHYDYRGSTTAITNASQSVTNSYLYGAFGELYGSNETGFTNAYRYVGKYGVQFEDTSMYFMRARYYSPSKGRFLGEDPVWNKNLYAYAENNPVNYIDPNGLFASGYGRSTNNLEDAISYINSTWLNISYIIKSDNLKFNELKNKLQGYLSSKTAIDINIDIKSLYNTISEEAKNSALFKDILKKLDVKIKNEKIMLNESKSVDKARFISTYLNVVRNNTSPKNGFIDNEKALKLIDSYLKPVN